MQDEHKKSKRTWRRALVVLLAPVLLFLLLHMVFPLQVDVVYAPVIYDRNGVVLHTYMTPDQQWRIKTRPDDVTARLKQTILFKEDRYFYYHFGVNPAAMVRAAFNNIRKGRRTSGASTISMQVARMLDRKPRTYFNKVKEMFRAVQLELQFSKDEILQLYLNLVPYGSNIQGVKAASLLYFEKSPDQLSLAEITALSIIPNRPNSLVPGRSNALIVQERNKWLQRIRTAALFSDELINDALEEPLTAFRRPAPAIAPQFCCRLRRMFPSVDEIHTTLDAVVQMKAEEITRSYCDHLKLQGIHNAAVLISDTRTRQVIAYIGSPDFHDTAHHGQVDGVRGLRSPGSALKPLLYGLAFDLGHLTPATILADVPLNIKGYAPENYDLGYRGAVTAGDALRQSLNIPAVKMLNVVGVPLFSGRLAEAGFSSIKKNRKQLGLSMILGGCEVRLDEMTAMYAAFANQGYYLPLQFVLPESLPSSRKDGSRYGDPDTAGIPLLTPGASYMLTGILRELHRPDLPHLHRQAAGIPRIAWKTGTSYGRRDAWSIGYNRHYTIGVWAGNFNGMGAATLNGAETATPLLFLLFNALDRNAVQEWEPAPGNVSFRMVCPKTGSPPAAECEDLIADCYIPGVSPASLCVHSREVWISAAGDFSYCTSCLPQTGYRTRMYPNIAPDLAGWLESSHADYEKIPPHNPECSRILDGHAPVITSLQNGMTYLLPDPAAKLLLTCNVANDVHEVFWYANDRFVGKGRAGETLSLLPDTHEIKISCTDDKGRNTDIHIKVKK